MVQDYTSAPLSFIQTRKIWRNNKNAKLNQKTKRFFSLQICLKNYFLFHITTGNIVLLDSCCGASRARLLLTWFVSKFEIEIVQLIVSTSFLIMRHELLSCSQWNDQGGYFKSRTPEWMSKKKKKNVTECPLSWFNSVRRCWCLSNQILMLPKGVQNLGIFAHEVYVNWCFKWSIKGPAWNMDFVFIWAPGFPFAFPFSGSLSIH